uniref:Uncharacterized protein n=1 Tax=viral metagenome TaxID=1070528 RepID=A0A6H2A1C6_9ZZZZ
MGRPKGSKNSVEDAGKLADELIAAEALERQRKEGSAPDDETPPVDDTPPLVEDEEEPAGWDLSGLDEEPPPPADDKELAHKLSVLQGKYNAETERLSTLLSQTMTEVQALKAQLANRPTPTPELANLSDDEAGVEKFKQQFPSLYDSFAAAARVEARAEVSKATKGTVEKVDAIVQQGAEEKKQVYYSRLSEALPNWEQLNTHPVFLKWLGENDEFSGTTRRNLIGAAFNRNDHATTIKFFNAFVKEKGIRVKGRPDDSDGLAPDTSGASVNRFYRSSGGEVTRAQMQQFYQDKAHKRLNMTDAEIAKLEAKFFQAAREGKIKG